MIPRYNSDLESLINEMSREELHAAAESFNQLLRLIDSRLAETPTLIVLKFPEPTDAPSRWQQN